MSRKISVQFRPESINLIKYILCIYLFIIRFLYKAILIAAKNYLDLIGRIIITFLGVSMWNGTLVKMCHIKS